MPKAKSKSSSKKPDRTAVHGSIRAGWFAPVAALLAIAFMAGAFMAYEGLGKALPNPKLGWAGVGVLVGAAVVAWLLSVVTRAEVRVDLKAINLRSGLGKAVEIRWAEEHDYFYRAIDDGSTPSVEKARVVTPDGRIIDIDSVVLQDFPNANLPSLVERYSTNANLPKLEERLEKGEDVNLGDVRLADGKIHIEELSHKLEDKVVIHIEEGRLRVSGGGKWVMTQVPVRSVPNFPCLLRIIGQIKHVRSPT